MKRKGFLGLGLALWAALALPACQKGGDDQQPNLNDSLAIAADTAGLVALTEVSDAQGHRYRIGFDQVTSINQDPYVEKTDANGQRVWKVHYEDTPVDGKGRCLYLSPDGQLWAAFSVDGGSNDGGYINRKAVASDAFSGVFANSYGSGGGPAVAVLARLDPNTGQILKGSFLAARLSSGNSNTLNIEKLGMKNGRIALFASTAAWPPGKGRSYARFPNISDADRINNAFLMYYELDQNLSEILSAKIFKP